MTEANTTTTDTGSTETGSSSTSTTDTSATTTDTGAAGEDQAAELEKWKNLALRHEDRAKANATAAKELETLKAKTMSDQEKAVEEAKKAGRTEALTETGAKLVKAEVRAALASRMDDEQIAVLVEGLNAANFLTEDGDVDPDKVKAFVDGIAPAEGNGNGTGGTSAPFPDLGQGARGGGGNDALNGDPILQSVKLKLGIT